jgi:hypothetical protein
MGDPRQANIGDFNPFSLLSPYERPSSPPNHSPTPESEAIDSQIDDEMIDIIAETTPKAIARPLATEFSSDPISGPTQKVFSAGLKGSIHRSNHMTHARKRTRTTNPSSFFTEEDLSTPTPITTPLPQTNTSRELILQARDLILKASISTQSRDEQARLLDLLELFREYTEKGRIRHASSILASQVANLENATRRIENQSRVKHIIQPKPTLTTSTTTTQPTSYANIAARDPQHWNQVTTKAPNKAKEVKEKKKDKGALSRATLIQKSSISTSEFSALRLRNLFNSAFRAKGIEKLVISTVSLSFKGNIVVYTTPDFNSAFLIQNRTVFESILPDLIKIQGGESWYKVVIYRIPIREFSTELGIDLVVDEIKTFNKGLTPIGRPY